MAPSVCCHPCLMPSIFDLVLKTCKNFGETHSHTGHLHGVIPWPPKKHACTHIKVVSMRFQQLLDDSLLRGSQRWRCRAARLAHHVAASSQLCTHACGPQAKLVLRLLLLEGGAAAQLDGSCQHKLSVCSAVHGITASKKALRKAFCRGTVVMWATGAMTCIRKYDISGQVK